MKSFLFGIKVLNDELLDAALRVKMKSSDVDQEPLKFDWWLRLNVIDQQLNFNILRYAMLINFRRWFCRSVPPTLD